MRVAITGANRGIGLALTKKYQSEGYDVVALCRSANDELKAISNLRIVENVDVTDSNVGKVLRDNLDEKSIDVFINNAGILESDSWEDLSLQSIEKQFKVNALGPLNMVKWMTPFLASNAKIAVLTSRMGSIGDNTSGGMYGYRISKAAANAACKSMALDLAEKKHPVAILHPGYVKTDMTSNKGNIEAIEAAEGLFKVIDKVNLETTGKFWHSTGEELPW